MFSISFGFLRLTQSIYMRTIKRVWTNSESHFYKNNFFVKCNILYSHGMSFNEILLSCFFSMLNDNHLVTIFIATPFLHVIYYFSTNAVFMFMVKYQETDLNACILVFFWFLRLLHVHGVTCDFLHVF